MPLDRPPAECPDCREKIRMLAQKPARTTALALALYFGGAAVSVVAYGVFASLELNVALHVRGAVALAPAVLCTLAALRLPRIRTLRCHACGWSDTVKVYPAGSSRDATRRKAP